MALRRKLPLPALVAGVGLLAAGSLILVLNRDVGFFLDEWEFLIRRTGFDALLEPHNEHVVIVPVAIYRLLIAAFGLESAFPFHVVGAAGVVAAVAVAFVYMRRRVGPWVALALAAPLAVLGPGWDNVLWPFQIGFTGAIACGIGALLLLEREEARTDVFASLLLVGAVCFGEVGLCITLAAAVALGASGRLRQCALVVAAPVAVYSLWWVGWGHTAESSLSWDNVLGTPAFVFDGLAASLASLVGVGAVAADPGQFDTLALGRPLLVIALVAAAVRLLSRAELLRSAAPPLVFAVAFWTLTALNANAFRQPDTGRFLFTGAIAIALIASDLLRGVRFGRTAAVLALVASTAAVAGNLDGLLRGRDLLRSLSEIETAGFTGVEIARDTVEPSFVTSPALYKETAALYLTAVDAHGSPGYSRSELIRSSEVVRGVVDQTVARALGVGLEPATASARGCTDARLGAGPAVRKLRAPTALLVSPAQSEVTLALRRYAREAYPVALGPVPAGAGVVIELPADREALPWELQIVGAGSVLLCPVNGA